MMSFQELDGKRVGVAVPLASEPVCVYGSARLESDATLGSMLRITVSDPAGSFDILLKEAEWSGTIEQRVADENCDYFVQLATREK